jgi:hypothetical protein
VTEFVAAASESDAVTQSNEPEETAWALLRGGPAGGREIEVPRIAETFPMFIGVDGGNYVRDKGAHDRPVYNWWPAGASSPAGDPKARTHRR